MKQDIRKTVLLWILITGQLILLAGFAAYSFTYWNSNRTVIDGNYQYQLWEKEWQYMTIAASAIVITALNVISAKICFVHQRERILLKGMLFLKVGSLLFAVITIPAFLIQLFIVAIGGSAAYGYVSEQGFIGGLITFYLINPICMVLSGGIYGFYFLNNAHARNTKHRNTMLKILLFIPFLDVIAAITIYWKFRKKKTI